jgi:hypothetical protein
VRLGPLLSGQGLGRLSAPGSSDDRHKNFNRVVGEPGSTGSRYAPSVMGRAAATEITGWPWDVLFFAQYDEEFKKTSIYEAFMNAVHERYGTPSSLFEQSGYMLWTYDFDGQIVTFDEPGTSPCRQTIEFWLNKGPLHRIHGLGWQFNSYDLGPWGCSVIMELNPNRNGGVSGYSISAASGYAMAINHFYQRIDETSDLLEKVRALANRKPRL